MVSSLNDQSGAGLEDLGSLVLGQDQDVVGGGFSGLQSLNGTLSEAKLSNIVRNADYAKTTFNNQDDNNAFWLKSPLINRDEV